jgi:hypothetical protein
MYAQPWKPGSEVNPNHITFQKRGTTILQLELYLKHLTEKFTEKFIVREMGTSQPIDRD